MVVSLDCPCGSQFEVDEAAPGPTVTCPECQRRLPVPRSGRGPLRTSGYAIASVVFALVLACTGVGTILAVLLGLIALVSIARNRSRLTGEGYALFGVVAGLAFTGLFFLVIVKAELFGVDEQIRERVMGSQVDRSGPLEVVRPRDGFAITRPSPRWGVAHGPLAQRLLPDGSLLLVNVARDAYVDVSVGWTGARTLEQYRDEIVTSFREGGGKSEARAAYTKVRQTRRLPPVQGAEALEFEVETREAGQTLTFVIRVIRPAGGQQVFVVRGWAQRRRFVALVPELRQALDSFRLLDP
jgi:hypothetical protein